MMAGYVMLAFIAGVIVGVVAERLDLANRPEDRKGGDDESA